MTHPFSLRATWPWLVLAGVLALAWLAYRPGLSGGFLFDDGANLALLGQYGPVHDWPAFWRYITSGFADPTGRPLALLTFLFDARGWPAAPGPFLRTNLAIHLVNGVLLFALLRRLGRYPATGIAPARNDATALLAAGLWLLHPLLVSTTLYVVQREAMLPATFLLLGLLAYVHGRGLAAHRPRAGMAWMVAGIGLGTLLGVLSKANGVLLPMLAWVLEATVLRDGRTAPASGGRWHARFRTALLVVPSVAVFAYLLSLLPRMHAPLAHRAWTIGERLLTEPRVMLDYLHLLLVPRVLSTGLYNDAYAASTSLLQPAGTLPALLALAALVALGFVLRRRAPVASAALLFFFAAHLLESTTIPLELYFEHRNYLPAMLLFWPVAHVLLAGNRHLRWRFAAALLLPLAFAAITWQRAELWGKPEQMARLWVLQNPASSRAQATAAIFEAQSQQPERTLQRLAPLLRARPHDLQVALNYANAACAARGLAPAEIDAIAEALRGAEEGDALVFPWINRALAVAAAQRCRGLDLATVERLVDAAWQNPRLRESPGRRQDLHSLAARIALQRHQPALALARFDEALAAYPTPTAAAMQAVLLATDGHHAEALAHLDHYDRLAHARPEPGWGMPRLHRWVLDRQGYWPRELALLRTKLRAEIAQSNQDKDKPRP